MRKATNILLTGLLGISIFAGVCNYKSKKTITWQKTRITGLETKIKKDFISNLRKDSAFSKLLDDTTIFYSDSLMKISNLYNKNILENKKLNKKVSELSNKLKRNNFIKGLDKKYNFLAHDYDSLKNEKDKLFAFYQKEISKNQELTNLALEKGISSENYRNSSSKNKFNVKNQNFFRSWKSIPPKLFSIGKESISFKDNDSEDMEAFARYESGRLIPLKKLDDSDKCSSFYLPYIDFSKGTIIVYAIDKDKNQSKEYPIYFYGGNVSKNKIK